MPMATDARRARSRVHRGESRVCLPAGIAGAYRQSRSRRCTGSECGRRDGIASATAVPTCGKGRAFSARPSQPPIRGPLRLGSSGFCDSASERC
ncbi:hypothetical protein [Lysobacter gummosus]|uniref:hypothetical protein n=1 Tax=Lysobacter gummosus TaxID=262324 RepID=UPI003645C05A